VDTNFKSDVRQLQRRKSLSGAQSFKECTDSQLGAKLLSVSFHACLLNICIIYMLLMVELSPQKIMSSSASSPCKCFCISTRLWAMSKLVLDLTLLCEENVTTGVW